MSAPRILNYWASDIFVKEACFAAGDQIVQHRHHYDHLAYLVSGRAEVIVDGERFEIAGPVGFTIEANKHHGVKALTDVVWLCIHSVAKAEGETPDDIDLKIALPIDEQAVSDIHKQLSEGA